MQYKTFVPLMIDRDFDTVNTTDMCEQLEKLQADTVMLAFGNYFDDEAFFANVSKYKNFLEEKGYKTEVWISSLLHNSYPTEFLHQTDADGDTNAIICPTDKKFVEFYCGWIKKIAAAVKPEMIFLDDDLRINVSIKAGCFCKNHMEMYAEYLGHETSREEMAANILNGKPSFYREIWLKVNGEVLENFAAAIRKAADEVNPDIAIGFCLSTPTVSGGDGVDAEKLAKTFAGKNRPFLRLCGAPYWVSHGRMALSLIVELTRSISSNISDDVFKVSEGDVWPRPRLNCPAAYLEGFDTALRTAGGTNGILKYGLDYYAPYNYETGYADAAVRNGQCYKAIEKMFGDKRAVGFNVAENLRNCEIAHYEKDFSRIGGGRGLVLSALSFCTEHSLPCCYNRFDLPTVVMGDAVRAYMQKFDFASGIITDVKGAKILSEMGVDTGLRSVGGKITEEKRGNDILFFGSVIERFNGGEVSLPSDVILNIMPDKNAERLTSISYGNNTYCGMYYYENADGGKFCVLPYGDDELFFDSAQIPSYYRQYLMADVYRKMAGRALEVFCGGNPHLYSIVSANEKGIAVGLWNFWPDAIETPKITLGGDYKIRDTFNCDIKSKTDGEVILSRIEPYGMCYVEMEKEI